MKKTLVLLLSLIFTTLGLTPVFAVKDGLSSPNHPRIVQLYFKKAGWDHAVQSCTGFLYTSRIVLTAAHCVHDGTQAQNKVLLKPAELSVGNPGALTGLKAVRNPVQKIYIQSDYDFYDGRTDYSYQNDFAAIVLTHPIANVLPAKLATRELIEELTQDQAMVQTGGYGGTSSEDPAATTPSRKIYPRLASFQLISQELGESSIRERMSAFGRTFYQFDGVSFMRYEEGTPHPCNGDSGSGYFIEEAGVFTYLGVTWTGVHPLCEVDDIGNDSRFKPKTGYVTAFRGIFMDLNVVEAAESYVTKYPSLKFFNCAQLREKYPNGVAGSKSYKNLGPRLTKNPLVSKKVFDLNRGLDLDKDNIVCEKTR